MRNQRNRVLSCDGPRGCSLLSRSRANIYICGKPGWLCTMATATIKSTYTDLNI